MPPPLPTKIYKKKSKKRAGKKLCATKSIDLYIIRYIYEELDR